jgi:hypothetical protein
VDNAFMQRQRERRADPVLGAEIDVAIACRDKLGPGVAAAFLRETGVPDALARRVLDCHARLRSTLPRRWTQQLPYAAAIGSRV